jgi:nucleotide-binding universal stress UspA family protein
MQLLRLKVVLAAFDYDDSSLAPLRAAHELAKSAAATLHAVHVDSSARRGGADDARSVLTRAGIGEDDAQVHLAAGEPANAIRALGDQVRADVIVLGPHRTRNTESKGPPIGSTALAVVTSSWAPCLVTARALSLPLRRVLVPVDLSDTARGALLVALSWASALRPATAARQSGESATETVQLTALHVRRPATSRGAEARMKSSLESELHRVRGEAGTWAGVDVDEARVESTDVTSAIADISRRRESDLIVLGTRGLGLDAVGRLGSVAAAVTQRVDTPVLLVPPAVWAEYARASEGATVR